jgi:quinolinate synthase
MIYQMNSLNSLLKVCHHLPGEKNKVAAYEAARFKLRTPNGKSIADVGCEPILHMRHFQVGLTVLSISRFIVIKCFGL